MTTDLIPGGAWDGDPPEVVAFLNTPTNPPYHLTHDYIDKSVTTVDPDWDEYGDIDPSHDIPLPDDEDAAWEASRCTWCSGSGEYSDEVMSRECPWCRGTGEKDADE